MVKGKAIKTALFWQGGFKGIIYLKVVREIKNHLYPIAGTSLPLLKQTY